MTTISYLYLVVMLGGTALGIVAMLMAAEAMDRRITKRERRLARRRWRT